MKSNLLKKKKMREREREINDLHQAKDLNSEEKQVVCFGL